MIREMLHGFRRWVARVRKYSLHPSRAELKEARLNRYVDKLDAQLCGTDARLVEALAEIAALRGVDHLGGFRGVVVPGQNPSFVRVMRIPKSVEPVVVMASFEPDVSVQRIEVVLDQHIYVSILFGFADTGSGGRLTAHEAAALVMGKAAKPIIEKMSSKAVEFFVSKGLALPNPRYRSDDHVPIRPL